MAKYLTIAKESFLAGLGSGVSLTLRFLIIAVAVAVIYKVFFQHSPSAAETRVWLEQPISNLKIWQVILLVWFISVITSDTK